MAEDLTFYLYLLAPPLVGEFLVLWLLFRYSRTHGRSGGWRRVIVVNLLSCATMVGLMFLGGELYYRYVYDTTDSLAYTKVSQQWLRRYCTYNSAGFRDNVQYTDRTLPGQRRISFLGDSFTAGHGIKSVEDRFCNIIRARHPEWDVHAIAKFGLDTDAELYLLQSLRKGGYQFDQVVLVYCLNDIADLFPDWTNRVAEVFADSNRGGWLREHSYFVDVLYHHYKAAHDPMLSQYYDFVKDGYRGSQWAQQQLRLVTLRDFVQSNGGRLLVVTFPFLQVEGKNYGYQFVHDELNQFWKEQGVPHLDLQPVFANLPPDKITVNRYDAHPNEYANALAADQIEKFLQQELKNSPGTGNAVSEGNVPAAPRMR